MSWHFSRVLVAAYSAANSLDGNVCAPSSMTSTQEKCSPQDKTMDVSTRSQYGAMCSPSTESLGVAWWILSLAASRAKTLAQPEKVLDSTESGAGYGLKCLGSLARFDLDMRLWKTHQFSLLGGLESFSETWPRWGMMRGGECWELSMPAASTNGSESGLWPTPQRVDYKGTTSNSKFQQRVAQFRCWTDGEEVTGTIYPHPDTYDALLGWPKGWSASNAPATDKFRQWLHSHGIF